MKRIPLSLAIYTILCAFIVSCAQLGFVKPETTEDKIYATYAGIGAAYKTIADLAQRKQITKEQGMRMIQRADEAKMLVDTAAGFLSIGNAETAERSLDFAVMILKALELELKDRK